MSDYVLQPIDLFKYRFKTEQEFIAEFGNRWVFKASWNDLHGMDELWGKPLLLCKIGLPSNVFTSDSQKWFLYAKHLKLITPQERIETLLLWCERHKTYIIRDMGLIQGELGEQSDAAIIAALDNKELMPVLNKVVLYIINNMRTQLCSN